MNIESEGDVKGNLFMPYSGLMVMKEANLHFNAKGFSRYIWDFESSDKENIKGRYLSYGQLEYFDLKNKKKSFNPAEEKFNWNYISGTTVKVLSDNELIDRGGGSSGHRHFSDETFWQVSMGLKMYQCFLLECMIYPMIALSEQINQFFDR